MNNATVGYYKESMAFAGQDSSFAIVTKDFYYSDANCTALTLIRSQSLDVTDINPNGTGWTYTARLASQSFAPQTTQMALTMNAVQSCGIANWSPGSALDTTNTGCNTLGAGSILDTLNLNKGNLFRALDEITEPNVISGTILQGAAYTRQN